jgi:hypothetical protein
LSRNPNAIHLLEKNIDKIDWSELSLNPNAIHLLEKNIDKIDWKYLSLNPGAIHILKKNIDKIDWSGFLKNPEIFTFVYDYDYEKMKSNMEKIGLAKELLMRVLDPDRLERICNTYKIDYRSLIKIYS